MKEKRERKSGSIAGHALRKTDEPESEGSKDIGREKRATESNDPESDPIEGKEFEGMGILSRKTRLRERLEATLEKAELEGCTSPVVAINMESGETHPFQGYAEAVEFVAKEKGRWYVATPGIRRPLDRRPEGRQEI